MRVALSTWANTMYGYSLVSCGCSLVPYGCSLGHFSYSWSRVALRTCSCSSRRRASTAVRATSAETFSAAACKNTRVSE